MKGPASVTVPSGAVIVSFKLWPLSAAVGGKGIKLGRMFAVCPIPTGLGPIAMYAYVGVAAVSAVTAKGMASVDTVKRTQQSLAMLFKEIKLAMTANESIIAPYLGGLLRLWLWRGEKSNAKALF